jgi:D-alanyl-lipoteichoic acid acyltransferase DltB (MBOAT superfamily)
MHVCGYLFIPVCRVQRPFNLLLINGDGIMQFNTYIFALLFMPAMVVLYFLCNKISVTFGKIAIIVGSIFFYTYSSWSGIVILGISLTINYVCVVLLRNLKKYNKCVLAITVLINVGLLLYFKYTNFAIGSYNNWFGGNIALKEIVLPLGISFFTFQQIAYIVAAYRNEIERIDLLDYLVYILYFPKILMGPLAEPVDFIKQMNNPELKKVNFDNVAYGIKIFSFGLLKKALIADTFANAVLWGYSNIESASSIDWILIMLFYTFEIYFDFSGYCDMATGVSMMLNIKLPINFDSPYKAISVRDFWKRWHISLTEFFTRYIYIPLGGSRRGRINTYINTMIVFLVSGFWHGANWTFVLWGILHGIFSIFDRVVQNIQVKIIKPIRWLITFAVVNVLWLLFRSESIDQWIYIIKTIFSFDNMHVSMELTDNFILNETAFIGALNGFSCMVILFFASLVICVIPQNNYRKLNHISFVTMFMAAIAFVWGVICLGGESVFIYNNF